MTETNSGYFLPMKPNKVIEQYEPRHAHTAAKGAFSDEARDALAYAVSKSQQLCTMDGRLMDIFYYSDYVHVVARNTAQLPCGNFDRKLLATRLEAS